MTAAAEALTIPLPTTTLRAAQAMPLRTMTVSRLAMFAPALIVLVLAITVGAGIGVLAPHDNGRSGSPTGDQRVTMYEMPKARRLMLVAACATLRGYPSAYGHASGSIQTDFAGFEQRQAAMAVVDGCRERFGARPRRMTEYQWALLYRRLGDEAICLRSRGYDIEAAPSYDAWRRSPATWDPFVAFAEEAITPSSDDVIACSDDV